MEPLEFELEDYTELFELFGEQVFCPVCQEDAEEGQRILEINECKHMFHEQCLEPWIRQKGTCPLCRVSIFGRNHRQIVYRAHLLALLHIVEQQILNERRLLTWILCDGILHRLHNATAYDTKREQCRELIGRFTMRSIHPLPIDFTNRNRILQLAGQTRAQLLQTYTDRTNRLRTWTDIIMMRQYVQDHSMMNPAFQEIWQ